MILKKYPCLRQKKRILIKYLGLLFQGFCNCLTVLYTLALCHDKKPQIKALAGASLCVLGNAGTLLTYGLGVVLGWRELAAVAICLGAPYVLGVLFVIPSDDAFDFIEQQDDSTKDIIVTFSEDTKVVKPFATDSEGHPISLEPRKKTVLTKVWAEVKQCLSCNSWWAGLILMIFYQFGGYNVVTFYSSTIINESN